MSKLLNAIRLGEEMSQGEFVKKLDISRSNLCDIEKGRRFISSELAEKFVERLGERKSNIFVSLFKINSIEPD